MPSTARTATDAILVVTDDRDLRGRPAKRGAPDGRARPGCIGRLDRGRDSTARASASRGRRPGRGRPAATGGETTTDRSGRLEAGARRDHEDGATRDGAPRRDRMPDW